jgi:hypothetical protein
MLSDIHVRTMVKYSAETLCTVSHRHRDTYEVLRVSDVMESKHPVHDGWTAPPYEAKNQDDLWVRWAGNTYDNWNWFCKYSETVADEFKFRFADEQFHAEVIRWCTRYGTPPPIDTSPRYGSVPTPFPQVMPEWLRSDNVVHSYRLYYASMKEERRWTRRREPNWCKKYLQLAKAVEKGRIAT